MSRDLLKISNHAFSALVLFVAISVAFAVRVEAEVRVVNGLTKHFTVSSGESGSGSVELENTGEEPIDVLVYQADYHFSADVGTVFGEPGTVVRSNAPWVRLGPSPVVVPPGETVAVPFEFAVPDSTELEGTYWSVIMIEPLPTSSAQNQTDSETNPETNGEESERSLGIQQRLRYAVQVITDVGEIGSPRIVPDQPKLEQIEDGTHVFQVDLVNEGNRWVVPAVWIELYSEDGGLVGRFEGRRVRLFPNTSVRQQIDLGALQPGQYQAILIADGGGSAVFGARYAFAVSDE